MQEERVTGFGVDLGYFQVKGMNFRDWRCCFPSVVGSGESVIFSLNGQTDIQLTYPAPVQIGAGAVDVSTWRRRVQDRLWWQSSEWEYLLLGALTELHWASAQAVLVLGLPVAWYAQDKDGVRNRVLGQHRVTRKDRDMQTFNLVDVRVLPQGLGVLCGEIFDDQGQVANRVLFDSRVAVVDVGGYTTNYVESVGLRVLGASDSRMIGAWRAVAALRSVLAKELPSVSLRDYEVAELLRERVLWMGAERVDLGVQIDSILGLFAEEVMAGMTELWNGCGQFRSILLSGGGAALIADRIAERYPAVRLVEGAVYGNVRGYLRFARRVAGV